MDRQTITISVDREIYLKYKELLRNAGRLGQAGKTLGSHLDSFMRARIKRAAR